MVVLVAVSTVLVYYSIHQRIWKNKTNTLYERVNLLTNKF